jgi:hypothetical protein
MSPHDVVTNERGRMLDATQEETSSNDNKLIFVGSIYDKSPKILKLKLGILSTHLRLGLPSGLFPSGFPTNIL